MTPYAFEKRVRRLLVLIPAARAAGDQGLPIERALALTGARSVRELQDDVVAVDDLAVSTDADADHLLVAIERGRVRVDLDMGFGRPPPLSLGEGAALLAALRPFARVRPVERAVRTIQKAVPDHLRTEVAELARATDLAVGPPEAWAGALEEAIDRRVEVVVEYRAESDGSFGRRTLEPRALFPRDGHWYLVAWNVEKGAEHLYRLDRIASVALGSRCFGDHKGPGLERLSTRRLYFASGEERRVVLGFSPAAAREARERWGAAAVPRPDGSVRVALDTTPNEYFYGLVLAWGGEAEVLAPADVREELSRRVAALRARYA